MSGNASGTRPAPLQSFGQRRGRQGRHRYGRRPSGLLLSALDGTIVGSAMARIVADVSGLDHYAWVATANLLTIAAAVPIFGTLSDIRGRTWFYIGGLILFMAASALRGPSQSMIQLIAFRGLQGVASGILTANAIAIIGELFPPAEHGKWQRSAASSSAPPASSARPSAVG